MDDDKAIKILLGIVIGIPLIILVVWLSTWCTQWAWNTFMVPIFKLPAITWWQALALGVLTGLFKSYSLKK